MERRVRLARAIRVSLALVAAIAVASIGATVPPRAAQVLASRFAVPASAREIIVVSSAAYDPPGYLANFRTFARVSASSPWRAVFPAWRAEIGSGDLRNVRREGDHATPTGVYGVGLTMYGNGPEPGRIELRVPPARLWRLVGRGSLQPAEQRVRPRRL